jgi:hypothetical protein
MDTGMAVISITRTINIQIIYIFAITICVINKVLA